MAVVALLKHVGVKAPCLLPSLVHVHVGAIIKTHVTCYIHGVLHISDGCSLVNPNHSCGVNVYVHVHVCVQYSVYNDSHIYHDYRYMFTSHHATPKLAVMLLGWYKSRRKVEEYLPEHTSACKLHVMKPIGCWTVYIYVYIMYFGQCVCWLPVLTWQFLIMISWQGHLPDSVGRTNQQYSFIASNVLDHCEYHYKVT